MLITNLEKGRGDKYRVYGEHTFLFALYGKELKKYGIEAGRELSDEHISIIQKEVLMKRARERALYMLERRPMTVAMMRDRLRNSDYTDEVILATIQFLEDYHYLDDGEYIRMYVESYKDKKSRRQIEYELMRKGADREMVRDFFEKHEFSEQASLLRQFRKYTRGKDLQNPVIRQKVYRYFYSKGFDYAAVEAVFNGEQNIQV